MRLEARAEDAGPNGKSEILGGFALLLAHHDSTRASGRRCS
jgi:hypothetical protein